MSAAEAEAEAPRAYDVKVYRYGCPAWADFSDAAMTQLRLAARLWNALVELQLRHEERVAQAWSAYPQVAEAAEAAAAAQARVAQVREEIRGRRQANRSTVPGKAHKAALAVAVDAARDAKAALKAAKAAVMQCAACAASEAQRREQQRAAGKKGKVPRPADCTCAAEGRMSVTLGRLGAERAQALVKARQDATGAGLYWGTCNDICRRRFPAAVAAVTRDRRAGTRADLKFRRFDGSGTLTTQVQWKSGYPLATPELLASGAGPWRNVARLEPWPGLVPGRMRGAGRRGVLRVRVSGSDRLELPAVIHRQIPADAEVKEVKVSRRRIAGQHRVSAAVAVRVPSPAPRAAGTVLDVDFGWASGGAGAGLKVARVSWGFAEPPPVPEELRPPGTQEERGRRAVYVVRGDCYEIWLSGLWRDLTGRPEAIRGDREDLFAAVRDKTAGVLGADEDVAAEVARRNLASWKRAGRAGDPPPVTAAAVARWRSPRKLAMLAPLWPGNERDRAQAAAQAAACAAWKAAHPVAQRGKGWRRAMLAELGIAPPAAPPGAHPFAGTLEEWRQRDRHLWEFEAHERAQLLARRRDAYRKVAAWLAGSARVIVIKDLAVAAVKQVPDEGREDTYAARAGRRQAQSAAPGELRAAIENAARMRGVTLKWRSEGRSVE